jgi:hypothetical protein
MNQLKRWLIWFSRIHECRGFGIQSPTDYAFVRYVVNEHWPYYAYERLDNNQDWLSRKLGKLYFRLANWRQPQCMLSDEYQEYWREGCRGIRFTSDIAKVELARILIDDYDGYEWLVSRCDVQSVIVVEGIYRDWERWHAIEQDSRVVTTFDLYYSGILFFDIKRYKQHYTINF